MDIMSPTWGFYLIGFLAFVINALMLYIIIAAASKSKYTARQLYIQTEVLMKIALKLGVDEKELNEIVEESK